jgi:hypothetical protein
MSMIDLSNQIQNASSMNTQYSSIISTIVSDIKNNVSQISSVKNPYLNKNVLFNNNVYVYVTNLGIARPYLNVTDYNNIIGKNGCPKTLVRVQNITIDPNNLGGIIPTNPTLIIGPPMFSGTQCGIEGTNVKVMNYNPEVPQYKGCFSTTSLTDNTSNRFFNYETCKTYAQETNSTFFGLTNVSTKTGYGNCVVGNNTDVTQNIYANGKTIITTPINLSPNTSTIVSVQFDNSSNTFYGLTNKDNILFFTCKNNTCKTNNYLVLQNTGHVQIRRMIKKTPNNKDPLLINITRNIPSSVANKNWRTENGKTGNNFLLTGQILSEGEWISSPNSKYKLELTKGVLTLLYSTEKTMCKTMRGKLVGIQPNSTAVYSFNNNSNKEFNNTGYIDGSGLLHPYTNDMITSKPNTTYATYNNYNIDGNDLSIVGNSNENKCKAACDTNNDCIGYTFSKTTKQCNLKHKSNNIKIPTDPATKTTLYLRQNELNINNDPSCSKKIIGFTPNQWNSYPIGNNMTPTDKCINITSGIEGMTTLSQSQSDLASSQNKIDKIMNSIVSDINYPDIKDMFKVNDNNKKKYNYNMNEYNKYTQQNGNFNGPVLYKEEMANMNTINEMLNDSELINIQQRYTNIFLTILAIGTIVFTINNLKK